MLHKLCCTGLTGFAAQAMLTGHAAQAMLHKQCCTSYAAQATLHKLCCTGYAAQAILHSTSLHFSPLRSTTLHSTLVVPLENPSQGTHFLIENENADANKLEGVPSPPASISMRTTTLTTTTTSFPLTSPRISVSANWRGQKFQFVL